ncbi:MAG TPA: GNAT family N-acetyltransferase [Sphingomicrobium sp.]|nr:GNAT family N-acetyltransferase [Sphingomicrobium sp.]
MGETAVVQHIGGIPATQADSWARLHRYVGHWALHGFGYWVVRERSTKRFVGEVGWANFRRGLGPQFDSGAECGWALAPWAFGQGFALEAVSAAIDWAAEHLEVRRAVCMIHPDNMKSARIARKVAFEEFDRASFKDAPVILFSKSLAVRDGQGLR